MNAITLKQANSEDWKLIRKLEKGASSPFFQPCIGEEGYKNYLTKSTVFIIRMDNKDIGTISHEQIDDQSMLIDGLTVLPTYRRRGIAKMAMEKLLKKIQSQRIWLYVHPQNTAALIIYLRLGFKITAWKDNVFGNNQPRLILEKTYQTTP